MDHDYFTRLSITLECSGGEGLDETNTTTTSIQTEMSDCSVHAWFRVFAQLLAMAGFQEHVIMQGGAQLAFNEERKVEDMRSVAKIYDLKLLEDIRTLDDESESSGTP